MLVRLVHSAGCLLRRHGGADRLREPKVFTEPGNIRDDIPGGRTLNEDRHAADVCAMGRKWGRINPNMLARADAQSGSARAL